MICTVYGLLLMNMALAEVPRESCAEGDKACLDKIAAKLKKHEVIPDVIKMPFKEKMAVNFIKSHTEADYGNELTPTNVRQEPEVSWSAEEGGFYVISMVDPDAPSRKEPKYREWLHWLVVNVPGTSVNQGTTLAGYIGSGPPKGTGLHRYVLLAYKQPGKITFNEEAIPSNVTDGRTDFGIAKFAEKYKLGGPVAGNFFQAQFEETGKDMAEQLKKHGVIPDVIENAWKEKMAVNYRESNAEVDLGNELTPSQVKLAPEVSWTPEKTSFYVLCMTDPDAPSRIEPKYREFLHWLVVNVPGESIQQGTTLAGYRPSGPPKGTGLHRYIFLAYKQPEKLTFDEKVIPSESRNGRMNFNVAKFAKKYNLGDPVAGNFFQAQFEEKPDDQMAELLKTHGVIPDVIEKAWKEKLAVNYQVSNVNADLGNELTPSQVHLRPEVTWSAEAGSLYVVSMVDPDAPSRKEPKYREWLHWLVVNVPGTSVNQGTTLAGYIGSGPPKGTGLHRYVLLAYKQPGELTFNEEVIPSSETDGRTNFGIAKFAEKYNLGGPVAGNFFEAQYQDTPVRVPNHVTHPRQTLNKMSEELKKDGIIPDVIETPWKELLAVKFPASNVTADLGNELTPTDVRKRPDVSWNAEEGNLYVVCMTDPDAPSRKDPKAREWLHWLVGNVSGNSVKQGTTIADYVGSAPPKGSGLHRYVLLVYKQPRKLTFDEKVISSTTGAGRARFTIMKFAKKYELGEPVAGNFFQAQWDTTSDAIHKSLK